MATHTNAMPNFHRSIICVHFCLYGYMRIYINVRFANRKKCMSGCFYTHTERPGWVAYKDG